MSVKARLLIGSWADADRLIDQPFPAVRGVDPVEPGAIRRRLEVLEWDADVHSDGSRTPGASHAVVAPATMVSTFALPSYWTVGDPPMYEDGLARLPPTFLDQIPAPGNKMMVTNWSLTTFRYLRLGEYVESTTTLVRIARKTTRLGEGAFLTLRTEYSDATGEPVASRDLTVFRY